MVMVLSFVRPGEALFFAGLIPVSQILPVIFGIGLGIAK